jgi:hypothetical protein
MKFMPEPNPYDAPQLIEKRSRKQLSRAQRRENKARFFVVALGSQLICIVFGAAVIDSHSSSLLLLILDLACIVLCSIAVFAVAWEARAWSIIILQAVLLLLTAAWFVWLTVIIN